MEELPLEGSDTRKIVGNGSPRRGGWGRPLEPLGVDTGGHQVYICPSLVKTDSVRVLGVVLLLAMTSIGCGAGDSRYEEEVRNNFLVNCQYEADASSCERALNCIEGELSQGEFEYEENLLVLTGELSDRMADVMARSVSS